MPKLPQKLTLVYEVLCLVSLLIFQYYKSKILLNSSTGLYALIGFSCLSFVDMIFTLIYEWHYTWVSAFLRPILVILYNPWLKKYWIKYLYVMKDTIQMVVVLIIFIMYYSWMLQRFFRGTSEGEIYFKTFAESFYNMLILLTTANFPDVMLPAYNYNKFHSLFFVVYLIISLYLGLSLLLAQIYSNFTQRQKENLDDFSERRSGYLYDRFVNLDKANKGYLNKKETYVMMCLIHNLAEMEDEVVIPELMKVYEKDTDDTACEDFYYISPKQFNVGYKTTILPELEEAEKFRFDKMSLLVTLLYKYQYFRQSGKEIEDQTNNDYGMSVSIGNSQVVDQFDDNQKESCSQIIRQ